MNEKIEQTNKQKYLKNDATISRADIYKYRWNKVKCLNDGFSVRFIADLAFGWNVNIRSDLTYK